MALGGTPILGGCEDTDEVDRRFSEFGARDQFQRYEVMFAAGDRAGVPGKERAALWHERAIHDLGARFGSLVGG